MFLLLLYCIYGYVTTCPYGLIIGLCDTCPFWNKDNVYSTDCCLVTVYFNQLFDQLRPNGELYLLGDFILKFISLNAHPIIGQTPLFTGDE